MSSPRTITKIKDGLSYTTLLFSEQSFQSSWSHPDVPVLVFADSKLPGFSVQHHGGPVGSGMPVELLFWGDWWNSAEGISRQVLIITRVQAVLASDYFSELKQYGIDRPHWRGAKVVTSPGPPSAFNSKDDVQAVPDLIDDLIDDDVFPDPDDEKIAFIVFMPKGFTESIGELGSHTKDYNYTFPWDIDWYWVAWVKSYGDTPDSDPEDVIGVFTHELVEMLSDPEADAWYADNPQKGEIGDAAIIGGNKSPKLPGQAAWVNGAHVTAYWSNQYGKTVIPIDRDYQARILGKIRLEHRDVIHSTFRPDPNDSRLCNLLPQCCFADRDYKLTLVKRDEIVHLSVETQRYRQPQLVWTVEGNLVTNDTTLWLDVIAEAFDGHKSKIITKTIAVQCKFINNDLTLRSVGNEANFDITVSCTITDGSITGNILINVIAKPAVTIGFVGVELIVDAEYENQRKQCEKAAAEMLKKAGIPKSRKAKIGDPVEFSPTIIADVPAYARILQYEHARRVVDMIRMANAVLPKDSAQILTSSLIANTPILQAAMAKHTSNDKY